MSKFLRKMTELSRKPSDFAHKESVPHTGSTPGLEAVPPIAAINLQPVAPIETISPIETRAPIVPVSPYITTNTAARVPVPHIISRSPTASVPPTDSGLNPPTD